MVPLSIPPAGGSCRGPAHHRLAWNGRKGAPFIIEEVDKISPPSPILFRQDELMTIGSGLTYVRRSPHASQAVSQAHFAMTRRRSCRLAFHCFDNRKPTRSSRSANNSAAYAGPMTLKDFRKRCERHAALVTEEVALHSAKLSVSYARSQ